MFFDKKKFLGGLLFALVCWVGCDYSGELSEVQSTTTNGQAYSISYPDYMTAEKAGKLSPTAKVQYCNYFRNVYSVVTDTIKTDSTSFGQYAQQQTKQLISLLQRPQKIDSSFVQIDGKKAIKVAYTGTVGKEQLTERIYYQLVFVEGKKNSYLITLWTWDKWRQKYLTDFDRIEQSFKER